MRKNTKRYSMPKAIRLIYILIVFMALISSSADMGGLYLITQMSLDTVSEGPLQPVIRQSTLRIPLQTNNRLQWYIYRNLLEEIGFDITQGGKEDILRNLNLLKELDIVDDIHKIVIGKLKDNIENGIAPKENFTRLIEYYNEFHNPHIENMLTAVEEQLAIWNDMDIDQTLAKIAVEEDMNLKKRLIELLEEYRRLGESL